MWPTALRPEHLELCMDDFEALLPRIQNAGSIFLGQYAPEPLGDYFAGTTMFSPPTGRRGFPRPCLWTIF